MRNKLKKTIAFILSAFMIFALLPAQTALALLRPSVNLGSPTLADGKYYYESAVVEGSVIRTLLINFSDEVAPGDTITLPAAPEGFTVSGSSNDYTKRINIGSGIEASAVQSYLRGVGFSLGNDSQTVQVVVSSENIQYDTYYSSGTQHYYQFVPLEDASETWITSYDAAKGMTYMGRTGYLATVTSEQEDRFIMELSGEVGWLGGTRMAYNSETDTFSTTATTGYWYWACGPEKGNHFYDAQYVTLADYSAKDAENASYYFNWNRPSSGDREPNSNLAGGETCLTALHIGTGYAGTDSYSWNDRDHNANYWNDTSSVYQPHGYVVEYGDSLIGDSGSGNSAFATASGTLAVPVELVLGDALFSTDTDYSFPGLTLTSPNNIGVVTINVDRAAASGETIALPADAATPGGTPIVITDLNNLTKTIIFASAQSPADVQAYLRAAVFKASPHGAQTLTFTADANATSGLSSDMKLTAFYDHPDGATHYYAFVNNSVVWVDAYNAAKSMKLMGMTGYLPTITSDNENDILTQISSSGAWSGGTRLKSGGTSLIEDVSSLTGSDYNSTNGTSDYFYWACGPEAGLQYYSGITATGSLISDAFYHDLSSSRFWYSGEPNNSDSTEQCMQVNFTNQEWNDLPLTASLNYFVEFGGYTGSTGTIKQIESDPGCLNSALTASTSATVAAQYAITYNLDGGANPGGAPTSYTYGTGATLPIPTRPDHSFGGWYTNSGLTGSAVTAIGPTDTGTKEYYAKWILTVVSTIYISDVTWQSATSYTCGLDLSPSSRMVTISVDSGYFTVPSLGTELIFFGGTNGTAYISTFDPSMQYDSAVFSYSDAEAAETLLSAIIYTLGDDADPTQSITATSSTVAPIGSDLYFDGHFYRYVSGSISWVDAVLSAGGTADPYFGGRGYIATAISQAENTILLQLTDTGVGGSDHWYDAWMGGLWQRNTGTVASPNIIRGTNESEISYSHLSGATVSQRQSLLLDYTLTFGDFYPGDSSTYIYARPDTVKYYWIDGPEAGQEFENNTSDFSPWHSGEPNSGDFTYIGWEGAYWDDLGVYDGDDASAGFDTLDGYIVEFSGFESGSPSGEIASDTIIVSANYSVLLNTNGGSVNSGNITSYNYGVGASLPADVTKTGHTFGGWFASSDLSGSAVTAISTTDTGNKTFWAKWTADSYTITYNLNGGTNQDGAPTGYTYGIGATLRTPTNAGHTFDGWFASSDLSGSEITEIVVTDTGNKTFWAKWIRINIPQSRTITVTETSSSLFDSNSNAILAVANMTNAFSSSVEVKVTDTIEAGSSFGLGIGSDVYPFDISLYVKGTDTKTEPASGYAVTISLPVPENLLDFKEQLFVVHKDDNGTVTRLLSNIELMNDVWYLVFDAEAFSPYALVLSKLAPYNTQAGLPYYLTGSKKVFIGFAADGKYLAPGGVTPLFAPNHKNFSDTSTHWGKSYIDFVTEREIFMGTGNELFSPDTGMTRAMFATVIGRLYERSFSEIVASDAHAFTDCIYDSYYGKYVDWAVENGIILGVGGGLFQPARYMTRQEMAAVLFRFSDFINLSTGTYTDAKLGFADASGIAFWAEDAALYCQETGIITGRSGGNFAPTETATRAEVAAIIQRFIELAID